MDVIKEAIIKEAKEELEREKKLKSVLVEMMDEAVEHGAGRNVTMGDKIILTFSMEKIPEDLKELFYQELPTLWGEISDGVRYFYITQKINVDDDGKNMMITLCKNWP